MRLRKFVAAFIVLTTLATFSSARPSPPAASMTVVLPAGFPYANGRLPLTLKFKFSSAEDRTISAESVDYVLLGEDGQQVAIDCFVLSNGSAKSVLKGTESTFEPAVSFDPYIFPQIAAGKKYQLVCTWKYSGGELAGSAWFTMTK